MIIAHEIGAPLRITSGPGDPARRRPGRRAVQPGARARCCSSTRSTGWRGPPRRCSTSRWRTSGSTSSSARARAPRPSRWTWRRSPWSGATTRAGLLPGPLRDRFGFTAHMDFYADADLATIVQPVRPPAAASPSTPPVLRRSPAARGGPRGWPTGCCAGSATTRRSTGTGAIDRPTAHAALDLYEVDALGLDRLDRAVLTALLRTFRGGPGRAVDPGGGRGGGARDGRDRGRAVPRPRGTALPDPARPGGDRGRLATSGHVPAARWADRLGRARRRRGGRRATSSAHGLRGPP